MVMGRVSKKALRPRAYVLNRLTAQQIERLTPGVNKLRQYEHQQAQKLRKRVEESQRQQAARHAHNIMNGKQQVDPESALIVALEKELEELKQKKRNLFACLKQTLDSGEDKPSQTTK